MWHLYFNLKPNKTSQCKKFPEKLLYFLLFNFLTRWLTGAHDLILPSLWNVGKPPSSSWQPRHSSTPSCWSVEKLRQTLHTHPYLANPLVISITAGRISIASVSLALTYNTVWRISIASVSLASTYNPVWRISIASVTLASTYNTVWRISTASISLASTYDTVWRISIAFVSLALHSLVSPQMTA
jgi:hypothetical protein